MTSLNASEKPVYVFLPMRAGSERVPQKNTRSFAGKEGGLCKIKIQQLLECDAIHKIYVSTDDVTVNEISQSFGSDRIVCVDRPKSLATSATSTDDLIHHAADVMPDAHILWTHVTSPFIGPDIYKELIKLYLNNLDHFDSLLTVTRVQKFLWYNGSPVNYDRSIEKWPRTQSLPPVWEVNSGAFLTSKDIYLKNKDRIGSNPFLYELDQDLAFDIDWLSDFKLAEILYVHYNREKL